VRTKLENYLNRIWYGDKKPAWYLRLLTSLFDSVRRMRLHFYRSGHFRVAALKYLYQRHPELDLVISDDGLQHYALERTIELAVVDGQRGFGNAHLLPAGPLREPLDRLHNVDQLLCNGIAKHSSLLNHKAIEFSLQPINFTSLDGTQTKSLDAFSGKTVHAFAGIGNPQRFFSELQSLGIRVEQHIVGDHANMPSSFFQKYANNIIIMTEKDAVKYSEVSGENIWYLPVSLTLEKNKQAQFMQMLLNKIKSESGNKAL